MMVRGEEVSFTYKRNIVEVPCILANFIQADKMFNLVVGKHREILVQFEFNTLVVSFKGFEPEVMENLH